MRLWQNDSESIYRNIIDNINREARPSMISDYVYDNVVNYCVQQIKRENYDEIYSRYNNSFNIRITICKIKIGK